MDGRGALQSVQSTVLDGIAARGVPRAHERRSDVFAVLSLATGLLAAYLATPVEFLGNDSRPSMLTAVSIAKRGDFDLDEYKRMLRDNRPDWPYYVVPARSGHVVSRFGIGTPLAAQPIFYPAFSVMGKLSVTQTFRLGRLVAALYVAAAAAMLFLCARRMRASQGEALSLSLAYGLGTTAFSVSSQALWQHGPAQFFLMFGLWGLLRRGRLGLALAGAALAAVVLCRPPDGLLVLALAAGTVIEHRRSPASLLAFALGALPFAIVLLAYNHVYFGAPWAFGQTTQVVGSSALPHESYWDAPVLVGFVGQLVSPSRGLFVYSPFLLFLLWRPKQAWVHWDVALRAAVIGAVMMLLMLSRYYGWYGGWCFGYRMLADAAPVLVLALVPVLASLRVAGRLLFAAATFVAIAIHAAGAYNYSPGGWDAHPDVDYNLDRLWSLSDSQLGYVFTRPKVHVRP